MLGTILAGIIGNLLFIYGVTRYHKGTLDVVRWFKFGDIWIHREYTWNPNLSTIDTERLEGTSNTTILVNHDTKQFIVIKND